MNLKLYNTLTREKQTFVPINPERVRMYVCGPTVYDYAHIGNARPVIVFDLLFRLLRHIYGATNVTYVRNITDVDDKINNRAADEYPLMPLNQAIARITKKTEAQFQKDTTALKCLPPTYQPRATAYISQMIRMIERLMSEGHAYAAEGHVLFRVSSMPDYGKLSQRNLDEMRAGSRVEVAPYKEGDLDFVLWKPSDDRSPGWDSPWGLGRPGWHIECSAMSASLLGDTFDIHGGGADLIFPHHENEVAQSECAHGHPLANVWLHNGFLRVEGEKMSKSLGNFVTINELLKTSEFGGRAWKGSLIKFAMLQTHYHQPLDWTVSGLEQSEARLTKWRNFAAERTENRINKSFFKLVMDCLCDDLNTPKAFAAIDKAIEDSENEARNKYTVYKLLKFLGLSVPPSNASKIASTLDIVIKKFSNLSENDWLALLSSVSRNPAMKSGEPKAATKLVANTSALYFVLNELKPKLEPVWSQNYIVSIRDKKLNEFQQINTEDDEIQSFVDARNVARRGRDFAESDRIRKVLLDRGIIIKDHSDGSTTWDKAE